MAIVHSVYVIEVQYTQIYQINSDICHFVVRRENHAVIRPADLPKEDARKSFKIISVYQKYLKVLFICKSLRSVFFNWCISATDISGLGPDIDKRTFA